MDVLLLLALCVCVCEQTPFRPEDGARLRGLWKLHMRDKVLERKVRLQHLLYCRVGIGFHLQILPGGLVGGVHTPTEYCRLKVFAMQRGVVGIRGVKSGLYLCMSRDGRTYAAERFGDDCLLKEYLEENHYTTYSSHPGVYLALSHKGDVKRGTSVSRRQSCTHFLPRRTT